MTAKKDGWGTSPKGSKIEKQKIAKAAIDAAKDATAGNEAVQPEKVRKPRKGKSADASPPEGVPMTADEPSPEERAQSREAIDLSAGVTIDPGTPKPRKGKASTELDLKPGELKFVDIAIKDIKRDRDLQPREKLTEEAIIEYADAMSEGVPMPAPMVVHDGKSYWLFDGFHRIEAALRLKIKSIVCEVRKGDRQYAIWLAASANLKHGVRRSNIDKRRAVKLALAVKPDASLREIAEHCAVTHEMVRVVKMEAAAIDDAGPAGGIPPDDRDPIDAAMADASAAIAEQIKAIETAREGVHQLLETKHGIFVSGQAVVGELNNAKSALRQAMPHERCPVCDGTGCETCRRSGWVSKQQWSLIPKTQKRGE